MPRYRSVRSQLMLLVLAVVLPLIGLVLYTTYALAEAEASQARASALSLAQITAANVEQFLTDSEAIVAQLAQRPLIRAVDPDQCDPFLGDFANLFPQFIGVGVVDASGQQVCSAILSPGDQLPFLGDRAWFQRARQTQSFTVSEVQVGRSTGRWVSVIAYPILGEEGQFMGVVVMPIDLVRFQTVLDKITLPPGTTITIVDADGTVAARSLASQSWIGQNMQGEEVIDTVLAQAEGQIRAVGLDDEDRLYGFTTVPSANWHVYAGIPASTAFAPVRAAVLRQGVLSLAVILLVSALAGYLRRQIERPMHSLLQVAEAVAEGRLDRRAPVSGPKEFAEVAVQFNHMLDVRKRHTDQLERHTRQLETIGRMGQAVASSLDLPVLLKRVLEHVDPLLAAEGIAIWTVEGAELHHAAARGLMVVGLTAQRLPTASNLVSEVLRSGHSIYIPDLAERQDLEEQFLQMAKESDPPIRAIQIVPLKLQGAVIGIMQAVYSKPSAVSPDDLQLLQSAANWTAIAIGNARQHEQLRRLTQQVISAQEEERKRLAQELHDEAGSALTALKFSLTMLRDTLPEDTVEATYRQQVQGAIDLTDETMGQLRLLSHGLRPPSLSHFGLNPALKEFCQDFAVRTGLSIDYRGRDLPPLPDTVSVSFYRFLQEALTNIAKHAEANEVRVKLSYDDEVLSLQVIDDGKGFDPSAKLSSSRPEGMGLLGMQERFRLLHGECQIESIPGQGTRLLARCPIPANSVASPVQNSRVP